MTLCYPKPGLGGLSLSLAGVAGGEEGPQNTAGPWDFPAARGLLHSIQRRVSSQLCGAACLCKTLISPSITSLCGLGELPLPSRCAECVRAAVRSSHTLCFSPLRVAWGKLLCAHLWEQLPLRCGCGARVCAITQPYFIFRDVLKTDPSFPANSWSQVPEAWVEAAGFLAELLPELL